MTPGIPEENGRIEGEVSNPGNPEETLTRLGGELETALQ
jgi:hypothetical protein